MPPFRIVQISDLHFAQYPKTIGVADARFRDLVGLYPHIGYTSSHDPSVARATANFLFDFETIFGDPFNLILVSGDVATTGSSADLNRAYEFFNTSPVGRGFVNAKKEATLGRWREKVFLLPGNHDRFSAPRWFLPGNAAFDAVFNAFWSAGQGAQRLGRFSIGSRDLVLIAADFTRISSDYDRLLDPFGHIGTGRVYTDRLEALVNLTGVELGGDNPPLIIWVIHFDPFTSDPDLQLYNGLDVVKSAAEHGVPVVLCGHTHELSQTLYGSPEAVRIFVCGTTTQYLPAGVNSLQVVEIDDSDGVGLRISRICFELSGETGQFVRTETHVKTLAA